MWKTVVTFAFFVAKTFFFILVFMLVRWTVPRFRYDQLMKLGWIVFFEVALVNILIVAGVLAFFPN